MAESSIHHKYCKRLRTINQTQFIIKRSLVEKEKSSSLKRNIKREGKVITTSGKLVRTTCGLVLRYMVRRVNIETMCVFGLEGGADLCLLGAGAGAGRSQ